MEEKKKILSKFNIKDYINDLELVLEEKKFDEEAKSLLLSIFYKIDNFYKDYMAVKKDIDTKIKYLEDYIKIIRNKCNKIEIMKPQQFSKNIKCMVDIEKGEIKSFPNEIVLLYAIYELDENSIKEEKYILEDFTKVCVSNVLNKGKTINSTEPIRDFNGWSWNVSIDDSENIVYNLIFQNILILLGYKYVIENISEPDVINNLKERMHSEGYGESGGKFLSVLYEICIILYNNQSSENHQKCFKYKKSLINRKNMIINRKEDIEEKTKKSSNISKQIQKIDNILGDIKLIRNEYEKDIKENPHVYIGISDYVESKEKEKQKLLKEIRDNNKVLNQKQYLTDYDDFETILNLYDSIEEDKKKVNIQRKLENLQKQFLECFKIKISKNEMKKNLYNIATELRYYGYTLYKKDKNIITQNRIFKDYEEVSKQLIDKMIDIKMIDTGFKSKKLNYEILKYIFKTKIMDLENLVIKIKFIENNQIEVQYYDTKMLEYKSTFEIPLEEEITNKKERKFKVFKIG